jgi:hypothetical protein
VGGQYSRDCTLYSADAVLDNFSDSWGEDRLSVFRESE